MIASCLSYEKVLSAQIAWTGDETQACRFAASHSNNCTTEVTYTQKSEKSKEDLEIVCGERHEKDIR